MRVIKHTYVGSAPYTIIAASIETPQWGIGIKLHDWSGHGDRTYGLRLLVGPLHFCWRLKVKGSPVPGNRQEGNDDGR